MLFTLVQLLVSVNFEECKLLVLDFGLWQLKNS